MRSRFRARSTSPPPTTRPSLCSDCCSACCAPADASLPSSNGGNPKATARSPESRRDVRNPAYRTCSGAPACALKIAATSSSIGAGFRGGMFFASLFLGALCGKLFALLIALVAPGYAVDPTVTAIVGMSALGVGVIGGPLTMTFLALEATGDLALTGIVLAASILSSLTVRELFGYSFSTWRLHLRGETIRGAQDVGLLRDLTVGRMMRTDVRTVLATLRLDAFRSAFPLGSTQRVVVVDPAGTYFGIVVVADAHGTQPDDEATVADICRYRDAVLLPQMGAREAATAFDRAESEELAVVDDPAGRRVIGFLSEAYLMRRYAEELDKARRDLSGE
ncbi:MAG: chloride channel protein [Rhizobiales bacterium]|nr:chloride channel protein [Hyphomicrobiales bacterium]